HIGILSVLLHQFIVCSAFLDNTVPEKENTITEASACKTVGNVNGGFSMRQLSVLQIEIVFRNRIKCCSGLVQNKNRTIFINSTSQNEFLHFSARKINAIVIDALHQVGINAVFKAFYLLPNAR